MEALLEDLKGKHMNHFFTLIKYILLISRLKNEILLVEPDSLAPIDVAPEDLPGSIATFLSNSCHISVAEVKNVWGTLGGAIWQQRVLDEEAVRAEFAEHGTEYGFPTPKSLLPPAQLCTNPGCSRGKKQRKLQHAVQNQAFLFTMDRGAVPTYAVHLKCTDCKTTYYVDYYECDNVRTHYTGVPDILQLGKHQYAERKLVESWRYNQNLAWMSWSNCAAIYRNLWRTGSLSLPKNWKVKPNLEGKHVSDGFVLLSLLLDAQRRKVVLRVPHGGDQAHRYDTAMQERNEFIRLYGQDARLHKCTKCVRTNFPDNGLMVDAVVMDGVTVGRPRCGDPTCKNPLERNHDRFCAGHSNQTLRCAVVHCFRPVRTAKKTCDDPLHSQVEDVHNEQKEAPWQLATRAMRARVAHPQSAEAIDTNIGRILEQEDALEETYAIESQEGGERVIPSGPEKVTQAHEALLSTLLEHTEKLPSLTPHRGDRPEPPPKIKAIFGRLRTHNEQLLICSCSVIIARETFFNAETIPTAVEFIKRTFRDSRMPSFIFFDNNCVLSQHIQPKNKDRDPAFRNTALPVDVFHFKCKHSKTDEYCKQNCDPSLFPALRGEGGVGWWFNSSIAEQTNVWFGAFHSLCREMGATKYDFFLDEMILMRNEATIGRLEADNDITILA